MAREEFQTVYNYDLDDKMFLQDLKNRHLFLNGIVDSEVISSIIYYILQFNKDDSELSIEQRKPIYLYINSEGGDVVPGFSLIDTILLSKTPVYTVNIGECSSMGFLIFIAGKKRFALPHSEFLLHDGFIGGADSTAKLRDRIEFEAGELADEITNYVLNRTKIDRETYINKYRIEWYFMPRKAKEIGVVDYIIGDGCTIDDII